MHQYNAINCLRTLFLGFTTYDPVGGAGEGISLGLEIR